MPEETPTTPEAPPPQVPDSPEEVPVQIGEVAETPPEPEAAPETPPEPEPEAPTEPEQPSELQQKAELYDLMASDPELVSKIEDHFSQRARYMGTPADPQAPTESNNGEAQPNAEVAQLRQELQNMKSAISHANAQLQIAEFRRTHPEATKQDEMAMGKFIKQHPSFNLEQAYAQVKPATDRPSQPESDQTRLQTSEGKGGLPSESPTVDIEAEIRNPNATVDIGEAARKAWNHAMAQQKE